jgi:uncharacterized coiled-coil protein SlyX
MNDKIEDLERLMAHQERQIQELNDIVVQQAKDIDTLKKYVKITKDKLLEIEGQLEPQNALSPTEEAQANKPPHY